MKQRLLAMFLALALCLGVIGACAPRADAYSDLTDPAVAEAVEVLSGMGIVAGYSDGGYHPEDILTRAQFCKLAVGLENKGDEAALAGYRTLFSDLDAGHWAAGYVNLAYTEGLVSGYGDGTFGPDDAVTAAQAATILLHILGYSNAEIGPFWPEDYMSKAVKLGLTDGVDAGADDPLTRGEAALMLRNLLDLDTADGKTFLSGWSATAVEHALVMDPDAESEDGRLHTAQVYADGAVTYYEQANALSGTFTGMRGTLLLDKSGKAAGFVPDGNAYRSVNLSKVEAGGLTDTAGNTYTIPSSTAVLADDEKSTYGAAWLDMEGRSTATLYYTESGSIDLVSFADGGKYEGVLLTGCYENASPNASSPSTITLLGSTFDVTDAGRKSLKGFAVGDRITVELDGNGEVRAAWSAAEKKAELVGVLDSFTGGTARVTLVSGVSVSGACGSSAAELVGGLVKVSSNTGGKLSVSALSGSAATGKWDVAGGTLGKLKVASDVLIYDQVHGIAAVEVELDDVLQESVPASQITYVGVDSAGLVELIVLDDVTGSCYSYGFLSTGTERGGSDSLTYTNRTVALENSAGTTADYVTALTAKDGAAGGLAVTPEGKVAGIAALTGIEGVSRADFTGNHTVQAGGYLLAVSGGVEVYNEVTGAWTDLETARAFGEDFTVYYDKTPETGGQVRLVVVEE